VNYDVHLTFEGDPALAAQWAGFAKKKAREFGVFCGRLGQSHGTKWHDLAPDVKLKVQYINGIQKAHILGSSDSHGIAIFPRTSGFPLGWGVPYTESNTPLGTYAGTWPDVIVPRASRVVRGPSYSGEFGITPAEILQYGNVNWKLLTFDKGSGYTGMRQRHNGNTISSFYHTWYYADGHAIDVPTLTKVRGVAKFEGHAVAIGQIGGNWGIVVSRTPDVYASWYTAFTFSRTGLDGGDFSLSKDFLFNKDGSTAVCVQHNASDQAVVEKITLALDVETDIVSGSMETFNLGADVITLPTRNLQTQHAGDFDYASSKTSDQLSFGYDWLVIRDWGGSIGPRTLEGSRLSAIDSAVAAMDGGIWAVQSSSFYGSCGNDTIEIYEVVVAQKDNPDITNTLLVITGHAKGWEFHAAWGLSDSISGVLGGRQVLGIDFIENVFTDESGKYKSVPAIAVLAPSPSSIYNESRSTSCNFDSVPTYTPGLAVTQNVTGSYANGEANTSTTSSISFTRKLILDVVVLADANGDGSFSSEVYRGEAGTILDEIGEGITDSSAIVFTQAAGSGSGIFSKSRTVTFGNYRRTDNKLIIRDMNISQGAFVVHNVSISRSNTDASTSFSSTSGVDVSYLMAFGSATNSPCSLYNPIPDDPATIVGWGLVDFGVDAGLPSNMPGYTEVTSESLKLLRANYANNGTISKTITPAGGDIPHSNVVSSPSFTGTALSDLTTPYSASSHNDFSITSMQVYRDRVAVVFDGSYWGYSEYATSWANNAIYYEPIRNESGALIGYTEYDIRALVGTTDVTSQKLLPNRFGLV
jgi:hypothetical protein